MNDHELARHLAHVAGELLLEIRGNLSPLPDGQVAPYDQRALGDQGDRQVNEFLISQLDLHRPHDVVLSEESADPQARHAADRVWIIDPLDGTSSFARGYPGFAVHVALWERGCEKPGSISAAAVAAPMFNVTLSTADDVESLPQVLGSSSQIAQLHNQPRNNIRIVASPSRPPVQMADVKVALENEFNLQVDVQRMGSVGAKTVYIVLGQADIYLNTSGFYEWDLAAPLGVAHHYGLDVFLPSGAPILFNQIDVSLGGALISRPEFVPTILKSLA